MSKLKILHILTGDMGLYGIGRVVRTYTYALKEEFDFNFIICGKIESADEKFINSIDAKLIPVHANRLKNPIKYMNELATVIDDNKYDIIHVHGNSGTMYFETHAGKMAGIKKIILHCHNTSCRYKLIHHILKSKMNKEMTIGIACSKKAGEWVYDRNFIVLNNAIDVDLFRYDTGNRYERRKYGIDDKYVLLNVGRLSKQKNQAFLINLLPNILQSIPNAVLLFVGDGEDHDTLKNLSNDLGISDKVFFVGSKENVAPYYSMADLFVFPSIFEGLGLVLVEAQANGLKCIASTEVPMEANVAGAVSFLPLSDSHKWIQEIIKSKHIVDRAENSKRFINKIKENRYDIKTNVDQLRNIYIGETK